jgi:hydroxypyruvate isomerase
MSMLFGELPVTERPAAAAAAGFRYVESWWPFPAAVPRPEEVRQFCDALDGAQVRLVAVNLDAGDIRRGERGLLSDPAASRRFAGNLEAAVGLLARSGCRTVNALYGNRLAGCDPAEQDRTALDRIATVASRLAALGSQVVVETLSRRDNPDYPLTDIAATARFTSLAGQRAQTPNVGLLLDVYHLAAMGADPVAAIYQYAPMIRHVQFADMPGRGRPGTGALDFAAIEQALLDVGYDGFVGLEYVPD